MGVVKPEDLLVAYMVRVRHVTGAGMRRKRRDTAGKMMLAREMGVWSQRASEAMLKGLNLILKARGT